jgi:hypothetical protein
MNGLDLGVERGWKEEHGIRPILRRASLRRLKSRTDFDFASLTPLLFWILSRSF